MADVETAKPSSLSEQYLLNGKEETTETTSKPVEEADVKTPVNAIVEEPINTSAEEVVAQKPEETPALVENGEVPAAAAGESAEAAPVAETATGDDTPAGEEATESAESEDTGDQEDVKETPEIKLETAPADFRFPTTNQTRHCFTRYVEYHRCTAAKGEGAPECQKFAKYYRSLCPGEWVERWNEQRENGTFPGPL